MNYYENNQYNNSGEKKLKAYVRTWVIVGVVIMAVLAGGTIGVVALLNSFNKGEGIRYVYGIEYEGDSDTAGGEWIAKMMAVNVVQIYAGQSAGSGFIITMDGGHPIALTNYHVIESSKNSIGAYTAYDTGAYVYGCDLLGYDEYHDIAVLRLPASYNEYTFLDLMDTTVDGFPKDSWFADPVLGERIYAYGNALNQGLGMTDGVCSKQSTLISLYHDNGSLEKTVPVFQTTAAINSGMSGCPVFNKYGQIVGVGTYKAAPTGSTTSEIDVPDDMNYAVPSNIALTIYNKITSSSGRGQVKLISASDGSHEYTMSITETTNNYQFNAFGYSSKSSISLHGALGFSGVMRSGIGENNSGLEVKDSKVSGLKGKVITEINGKPVSDYGKLLSVIYSLNVISTNTSDPVKITLSDGTEVEWQGQSGSHYRVVA